MSKASLNEWPEFETIVNIWNELDEDIVSAPYINFHKTSRINGTRMSHLNSFPGLHM